MFYVGNQGQFDTIVRGVLRELKKEYPQINYAVVLAYIPGKQNEYDDSDTMLPEGIESVHPRYAISWRNNWMLRQSDYVVTYSLTLGAVPRSMLPRQHAREKVWST